MAEWIEIPAHRILRLTYREFWEGFDVIIPNGERVSIQELIERNWDSWSHDYIYIRKTDAKQFKAPQYHRWSEDWNHVFFLQEM